MALVVGKLAIIGQGHIGSSIARAVIERSVSREVTVTDADPKVRKRVAELGFGIAKVVDTSIEAVRDADLVIACIPVGQYGALAKEIGPHLKPGSIFSDVGSVKSSVVRDVAPHLPPQVNFIPAHPLAGTERSGPDSGLADLFSNRWLILTPLPEADKAAVATATAFWQELGSYVEVMSPDHHDHVLAITSHMPHVIAFTIFHTALRYERDTDSEVMKYSAGGFRDFTRIASSNPTMWRDIFLNNKDAILDVLDQFNSDLKAFSDAIRNGDADKLVSDLSTSRLTRRKVIEKEHISVTGDRNKDPELDFIVRPYGSGD
ncbi:MAG TPA: prephenate dehydrogenase/arogenate dehydrogenase family protein [Xanthobacteraceae bacterium]|nr:prephenate dehydrogenase/arogenate dehydrogenase family protein [Xanthobacteraceae bacterium]